MSFHLNCTCKNKVNQIRKLLKNNSNILTKSCFQGLNVIVFDQFWRAPVGLQNVKQKFWRTLFILKGLKGKWERTVQHTQFSTKTADTRCSVNQGISQCPVNYENLLKISKKYLKNPRDWNFLSKFAPLEPAELLKMNY